MNGRRSRSCRRSKWCSILASTWIQSTSGSSYCFSLYSPLLKSSQSYSQYTLDSVAFFKDVGANVGVLSGVSYSYLGPRFVLAAGAAQCFAGYLFTWMSVIGILPRPPVALMCGYMLIAAHAQTFFNTADVVAAVENFPESRGTVIGIMKGFLGLSGAILIQLYQTVFNGKASSFILMLALLPSILPLLLMYFVQVHHDTNRRDDSKRHLDTFSLIALITAAYLMLLIIGAQVLAPGLSLRIPLFALLLLLLLSPLIVVAKTQFEESSYESERKPLIEDNRLHNEENFNILQAMQMVDFWLLCLAMACGMGSGLATINNMSQIGSSLGYSRTTTNTLISLWSIWNFLGRFGSGYLSDYVLRTWGWARPLFIAITLGVMSTGHLVISSGLPGSLPVGSVLVGVCYGSQWALMPSITSELFGLRHFGTIFNTIAIASPVGSYVLSVRVVGYIYDVESSGTGTGTCVGRRCFMLSFLIMAAVTLSGFVASLVLFFRTRGFYKQVVCARLPTSCAR